MKVLIIGYIHHKNKIGITKVLSNLNYKFLFIDKINDYDFIKYFDIIFSPAGPIDIDNYKDKIFIFGPHFSVLPDHNIDKIAHYNNSIYIQPSKWAKNAWNSVNNKITINQFPFPVDIEKFSPIKQLSERDKVFIYFKHRNPIDLSYVYNILIRYNINPIIFNYDKKYSEDDYLDTLQNSKYGIIIDAHESQGFAIQEALACNVPLLVWNIKSMKDEYLSNYPDIEASTIPYWDDRCGEYFYEANEFTDKYIIFLQNINNYKPRDYILENLSVYKCTDNFKSIINTLLIK
jgi:hypothetical protein